MVPGNSDTKWLRDLKGKKVGVQTGSSFDGLITEKLPQARKQYFNAHLYSPGNSAYCPEAKAVDAVYYSEVLNIPVKVPYPSESFYLV